MRRPHGLPVRGGGYAPPAAGIDHRRALLDFLQDSAHEIALLMARSPPDCSTCCRPSSTPARSTPTSGSRCGPTTPPSSPRVRPSRHRSTALCALKTRYRSSLICPKASRVTGCWTTRRWSSRGQRAAVRSGPGRGGQGAGRHQRHGHGHVTPLRRVQGGQLGEQRRGILVDVGHDSSACLCPLVGAQFTK